MRDRLYELIVNIENELYRENPYMSDSERIKITVDHLLAAGVIVPPCKVGDVVYEHQTAMWECECGKCEHFQVGGMGDPHECARTKSPFKHPDCTKIEEVVATQAWIYSWLAYSDFGKTVFLTKEEAEKALKERSESDGT